MERDHHPGVVFLAEEDGVAAALATKNEAQFHGDPGELAPGHGR